MTSPNTDIHELVSEMTIAEKIGQMTQVSNESITPAEVANHFIGSVLSGGNGNPEPNTPAAWVDMVGAFKNAATETRLGIPLLYGVDAVHGHGNVGGATVFPHNIGLGAAGDEDLVERIGRATAVEMLATGVRWAFAPTVAVPQDIRWGRTYEGYGRDPTLVSALGAALIRGLQAGRAGHPGVVACAKHFVGDGATAWGSVTRPEGVDWWDAWGDSWQIDQGNAQISESDLRTKHLTPYIAAIDAGVMTVMASYSSWNGMKMHANHHLLTNVLKGELGFDGFVISDWMGVDQVSSDYQHAVVTAVNAGVDMVMVPDDYHRFIDAMTGAISAGLIAMDRIDDSVLRILRVKLAAGMFETGQAAPAPEVIGSAEHRSLAAEAVRRSAVLLKDDGTLPIAPGSTIYVAGPAASDVGLQCGGWTVGWQGGRGSITAGTTLLEGLLTTTGDVEYDPAGQFSGRDRADYGIVCIAEQPYAEGPGDCAAPAATDDDRAMFAAMRDRSDKLILVIFSGRPLVIPDLIAQADAVIAAWLPGTEGAPLADLLVGLHPFTGRTPQPWPGSLADIGDALAAPLFSSGFGLDLTGVHLAGT